MTWRKSFATAIPALAALIFLGLAATRRLNFDESLALRAGWLDVAGEPSSPALLMPWTLLAGAVGQAFGDPGAVFLTLRALAAGGVALAFWAAARASALGERGLSIASLLAISSAVFATHGMEFRYDAVVLMALLVGYRVLVGAGSALALGALGGVLALHHLKGAFFAIGLVALCLFLSRERLRDARRLFAGAAASWGVWLALLALLGLSGRYLESLGSFFALASASTRAPLTESLGPVLRRDLAWWLFVLVAISRAAWGRKRGLLDPRDFVALALAVLGLLFWLIHPHAWAYLAALPVPFLAFATAKAVERGGRDLLFPAVGAIVGLALQVASGSSLPLAHLDEAARAPMASEVSLLRGLRDAARPEDRVLDPSGLLYFLKPCTRDWYVDTLYAEQVARGSWMRELRDGVPDGCSIVLSTYRLGALPRPAREALARSFIRLPNGLAVRTGRALPPELAAQPGKGQVESFW